MKCCVKKCGAERPKSEMRPHKLRGRLIGYRCKSHAKPFVGYTKKATKCATNY